MLLLVLISRNLVYIIIYAYMLIYVKILKLSDHLKPVNIFKIGQILSNSKQNIDFQIL